VRTFSAFGVVKTSSLPTRRSCRSTVTSRSARSSRSLVRPRTSPTLKPVEPRAIAARYRAGADWVMPTTSSRIGAASVGAAPTSGHVRSAARVGGAHDRSGVAHRRRHGRPGVPLRELVLGSLENESVDRGQRQPGAGCSSRRLRTVNHDSRDVSFQSWDAAHSSANATNGCRPADGSMYFPTFLLCSTQQGQGRYHFAPGTTSCGEGRPGRRGRRVTATADAALPLALRNAGGPEPPQDRDDDGDDAQAPPQHLKLPYPVMLCRFQHRRRGRRVLGPKVPIGRRHRRKQPGREALSTYVRGRAASAVTRRLLTLSSV
jgi:hypothetical protein